MAIRCDKGKYISCRKAIYIPKVGWSALTEYRARIGEYEKFSVEFHAEMGGFSFKSHNGLYLHANTKFWTAACKEAPSEGDGTIPSMRSWCVSPLLGSSCEEERVEYVGVSNCGWALDMSLQAEGGHISEAYIDPIQRMVMDMLKPGESTHFCGTTNNFWHYFLRGEGTNSNSLYMVVTTNRFSRVLAGECVDDLKVIHEKYFQQKDETVARLRRHGMDRAEVMRKELQFLMWTFDDENDKQQTAQLNPVIAQMEVNISKMLENIGQAEVILQTATDIQEQSKQFKKRARKWRTRKVKKWVFYKAAIGGTILGGVGALVGWLIGGPVGTAFLGTQGMEIGAVAVAGVGVGALIGGATALPCMWKRYVPVDPAKLGLCKAKKRRTEQS